VKFDLEVDVAAPPARAFDVFTDVPGAPGRVSGIRKVEMLTPPPVGVGTRWKETRLMFGREATETMWVAAFEPPKKAVMEADSCGARMTVTFTFEPVATGTKVRVHLATKAVTWLAWFFAPLGCLFAGAARKMMKKDMEELARAASTPARG
jgi:hypothetical protein